MISDKKPGTWNEELSNCPRCGREFECSKSGKCWCYSVYLPPELLEEIGTKYDRCLCPGCLDEYTAPVIPDNGRK